MSWTYNGETIKSLDQFPPNTHGFIYRTFHKPSGKSYIGKKVLYHNKKIKIGKKELEKLQHVVGRKPAYRLAIKESDWKNYYGSQKDIKSLLTEGKHDEFERHIIKCAPNKKLLTYFETKYQFLYQVLEKPEEFFNDNILGKFFTKDFKDYDHEDPLVITST